MEQEINKEPEKNKHYFFLTKNELITAVLVVLVCSMFFLVGFKKGTEAAVYSCFETVKEFRPECVKPKTFRESWPAQEQPQFTEEMLNVSGG